MTLLAESLGDEAWKVYFFFSGMKEAVTSDEGDVRNLAGPDCGKMTIAALAWYLPRT